MWAHLCSIIHSIRLRYGNASPDAVPASATLPTPCDSPESPCVPVTEPAAQSSPVPDGLASQCISRAPPRAQVSSGIRKRPPREATSASTAATARAPRPKQVNGSGKVYQTFRPAESSLAVQMQWERRNSHLGCSFCTVATSAVVVCAIGLMLLVCVAAPAW